MTKDVRKAITIIAQHLALIDRIFEDGGYTDKDKVSSLREHHRSIRTSFTELENVLKEQEL